MSFGGRSFKKENLKVKMELQLLAKKSQTEFATLPPGEKAAILEQSSKTKLHEKTATLGPRKKKKKAASFKDEIKLDPDLYYPPPSPSIDLDLEIRGTPESHARDSVQLTGGERSKLLSSSQKVATIKTNVDLSVVMQGKSIADGDRISKASSLQSKAGQRSAGKGGSGGRLLKSATSRQGAKSPDLPAASGPRPAIIGSQNSTVQIHLAERESAALKQAEKSVSKASISSRNSAKSAASTRSDAHKQVESRAEVVIPSPDHQLSDHDHQMMPEPDATEQPMDTSYTPGPVEETLESDHLTPVPPDNVKSKIPENEYDQIHSEILKMTQTLSFPDISLLNLLSNREDQENVPEDLAALKGQSHTTQALLQKLYSDPNIVDFSIIGAPKSVSPRLPQTPKTPVLQRVGSVEERVSTRTGVQSYASPMKTISEANYVPSEARSVLGAKGKDNRTATQIASREWTGIVTTDSNLLTPPMVTDEQAQQDLELSLEVKPEDVINVKGQPSALLDKRVTTPVNNIKNMSSTLLSDIEQKRSERRLTFLSTWSDKDKDRAAPEHNIHHFCTLASEMELPPELHKLTRDTHTPDRFYSVRQRFKRQEMAGVDEADELGMYQSDETAVGPEGERDAEDRRLSIVAHRILKEAISADVEETLERLKRASESLFYEEEDESLQIAGVQIQLKDDSSRLYWTPAPPKMGLDPDTVKSYLYPEYQGAAMLRESLGTDHVTLAAVESIDEDDDEEDEMSAEDRQARLRTLHRAHGSLSDLTKLRTKDQYEKQAKPPGQEAGQLDREAGQRVGIPDSDTGQNIRFVSLLEQRRQQIRENQESTESDEDSEQLQQQEQDEERKAPLRRACSEPLLYLDEYEQLKVPSGYDVSIRELNYQKDMVAAIKNRMQELEDEEQDIGEQAASEKEHAQSTAAEDRLSTHESVRSHSTILDFHPTHEDTDETRTETETMSVTTVTSKMTGPSKMPRMPRMRPHKRRGKRKSLKDLVREQKISEFKLQPAHTIARSCSFHSLSLLMKGMAHQMLEVIERESSQSSYLKRVKSLPSLLDFSQFVKENSVGPVEDCYDWIREQFWYKWFDEVYPPSTASPQIQFDLLSVMSPRAPTGVSKSSGTIVNSAILDTVQVIEPEISSADKELYLALKEEAERLDELIEKTEKTETLAMHLCRRGAIHRKLGELKQAWDDLNRSIELERMLLDAYWHRHLLYLLQNNKKAALDDLAFIIKHSGSQARAFRSRAELYRQDGDATMAIVNYSQAIKLNPNDVETYYQRAEMFKMRGDMLLALEDFRIASKLLPSKTEAMFEIGIFRFNNENWAGADNDFTEILQQDPRNSLAYTYRGRVNAKMGQFNEALRDLSAAIHYNPNNAVAFYQRGCILRTINPRRALQDFSVSLLLDDSASNVNAFMHRGILYTDLKRWEEAIPDFEAAIELDSTLASAYVNIGLIHIIKYSNYQKAIRQYTSAIRVDPTYIRASICRAEAYQKMGMLQEAVLDYARAIHMRPDVSDYHMARGKLLLEQKKLDLASFHVKQAAELNQGLGASATQQAVVHSFLKNFDQAIEVLERATRVKPSAQMFVLLGKTNMKAKRFKDAITSFEKAIEILTPWNQRLPMPLEAASVYFLIGMCQSELHNNQGALAAFNEAIKVNPDYAEAFYQRGLTKMKLSHTKGVHDFNRALAINPRIFQAFLSRAAYYGMKGRYSKGIMSCNEAIKLQSQSVRAYLYRGALKYHIKAFSLAVKDLTEAVAIDCRCSLAYFNRAVCHHEMRYFQKALMDYGTVMLLEDKPNLKVLQNRGLLYLEIGDTENALEDFKAAAKVSISDPKIRHTLGLCYHKLNQLEESVAAYDDALRIDPFFVEAYNGRGNALMDFGHEQGNVLGRRDYLKALHMDPLCLPARVNLAYNLQVEGKFQAAWNQFSAAVAIDSTCQAALEGRAVINLQMRNTFGAFVDMNDALKISKTAELLNNRGVVHQYMGDYVNAVRDYQAAIRLDPSYALAYYNVGNVYFRQRQFKQALSYYNKALSWILEDESAVLNRAITKVMLRDARGAIQDFNKAVELNPYAAHVYFNRANLYASLHKYKEAEDDYTRALSLRPGDALVYKRRADVMGMQSKREAAIQDYKKAIIIKTRARAGRA